MLKTVRVEGLRELEKALAELPKAVGKGVLRRVLLKRAKPIAADARAKAPVDRGHLKQSIHVSTKRPAGNKSAAARAFAGAGGGAAGRAAAKAAGSSGVVVFLGPGRNPQSSLQEFGTRDHAPRPYMRPAWDVGKGAALDGIADDLWDEIKKSAARLAKRRAKKSRG